MAAGSIRKNIELKDNVTMLLYELKFIRRLTPVPTTGNRFCNDHHGPNPYTNINNTIYRMMRLWVGKSIVI